MYVNSLYSYIQIKPNIKFLLLFKRLNAKYRENIALYYIRLNKIVSIL